MFQVKKSHTQESSNLEANEGVWWKQLHLQLFAIGVPCGSYPNTDAMNPEMTIRVDGEFIPITKDEFAAWWQLLRPRRPETIQQWLADQGTAEGSEQILESLYQKGILRMWSGDVLVDRSSLEKLRIVPLGIGMGSSVGQQEKCYITFGLGGKDALPMNVTPTVYTVWAASDGRTSLLDACAQAAKSLGLKEREVWNDIYDVLPDLVGNGFALLDFA